MAQFVTFIGTFIGMGITYLTNTVLMQNTYGLTNNYDDLYKASFREPISKGMILLAIVGIMILYRIASPMTKYHWILWFAMIFGILFSMLFLNEVFAISALSRKCAMLLVIFAIITEPGMRYSSLLIQKIWDLMAWGKQKWLERKKASVQ